MALEPLETLTKQASSLTLHGALVDSLASTLATHPDAPLRVSLCLLGVSVEASDRVLAPDFVSAGSFSATKDRLNPADVGTPPKLGLSSLKRLWSKLWHNVCGRLVEENIAVRKALGKALKRTHEMLVSLSRSEVREIRLGMTVAAVEMDVAYNASLRSLARRKRIAKASQTTAIQASLEDLVSHLTNDVLIPRATDISAKVRRVAAEAVVHDFASRFEEKWKVTHRLLSDRDAAVRRGVLKLVLDELTAHSAPDEARLELGRRIKDRVLQMCLDEDIEAARLALETCQVFREWGFLEENDRKAIYRLLCDAHAKIRRQAGVFVASFFKQKVDDFLRTRRNFVVKPKSKLRVTVLTRMLLELVEQQTDLPRFGLWTLQYVLPEFDEFHSVDFLIACVLGKASLLLFEAENIALAENHETHLLTMMYVVVTRLAGVQLSSDDVLPRMSATERRRQLDLLLDASHAVMNNIEPLLDVCRDDEERLGWLVQTVAHLNKESILLDASLTKITAFLQHTFRAVCHASYDLVYHYASLLSSLCDETYPALFQMVSTHVTTCAEHLLAILDGSAMHDEEEDPVDHSHALIILFHYIKLLPLTLLRPQLTALRTSLATPLTPKDLTILQILVYSTLWAVLNKEDLLFSPHDLFLLLSQQAHASLPAEVEYELLGIAADAYFLIDHESIDKKAVEELIETLLVECANRKILQDPQVSSEYLYALWPVDALHSAFRSLKFSDVVLKSLSQLASKMSPQVHAILKKDMVALSSSTLEVPMELEDDPIVD